MKDTAQRQGFGPDGDGKECRCDHKLAGTGGVFFQSTGWIYCANCTGWQRIRKPVK